MVCFCRASQGVPSGRLCERCVRAGRRGKGNNQGKRSLRAVGWRPNLALAGVGSCGTRADGSAGPKCLRRPIAGSISLALGGGRGLAQSPAGSGAAGTDAIGIVRVRGGDIVRKPGPRDSIAVRRHLPTQHHHAGPSRPIESHPPRPGRRASPAHGNQPDDPREEALAERALDAQTSTAYPHGGFSPDARPSRDKAWATGPAQDRRCDAVLGWR
jgi:hypothetical protein